MLGRVHAGWKADRQGCYPSRCGTAPQRGVASLLCERSTDKHTLLELPSFPDIPAFSPAVKSGNPMFMLLLTHTKAV